MTPCGPAVMIQNLLSLPPPCIDDPEPSKTSSKTVLPSIPVEMARSPLPAEGTGRTRTGSSMDHCSDHQRITALRDWTWTWPKKKIHERCMSPVLRTWIQGSHGHAFPESGSTPSPKQTTSTSSRSGSRAGPNGAPLREAEWPMFTLT